ncbi:DUF4244 domain-containing protein [Arthrobacter sp.]|uniref:DUF4244 domain-containing protein n=1 Tax=Arthrobacter sp. TaxID=1667 RepID=UPI00289C7238|nr:DUF4244 domain-containing protein [Arthrobacter sp.]
MLSQPFEPAPPHAKPSGPDLSCGVPELGSAQPGCACSAGEKRPSPGSGSRAKTGTGSREARSTDGRQPAEQARLAPVIPLRPRQRLAAAVQEDREAGMATAEYAIATLAAVAFAALLVAVLSSGDVREMLLALIRGALSFG